MTAAPAEIDLVLDQGIPRDAVPVLRAAGFKCDHVGELGLSRAEDTDIIAMARERQACIVTLDGDFHALLATSGAMNPSVIRVRIQGLDGERVAAIVIEVLARFSAELRRGSLLTVKPKKTTCHLLPVGSDERI